jgi:8-oxo-dGTP pyrophosphatase MutT (NUDIX family)
VITTIWESEAKNCNNEPFFTVKAYKNRYIFGQRAGIDSIAFILLDYNRNKIGLINEEKPPLGDKVFLTTAFGGSLDKPDLSLVDIVKEEVFEEAGFVVQDKKITYYGKVLVSTQMNQICHLFTVDITNIEPTERHPDEYEVGSTVQWVDIPEIYQLQDWKAQTIFDRHLKGTPKNA